MAKHFHFSYLYFTIISLLVTSHLITLTAGSADHIVINEILYNPQGSEPGGEFIELYNPTDTSFCLDSWTLADQQGGTWTVTDTSMDCSHVIMPGHFIVIAHNGSLFYDNFGFYPDFEKKGNTSAHDVRAVGLISLKNSGDVVLLSDSLGRLIDGVVWGSGIFDSIVPFKAGTQDGESIERVIPGFEGAEDYPGNENLSSGVFVARANPTPGTTAIDSNKLRVSAHVLIHEILFNPSGVEPGGEFVEIYNPADSSICIDGWYIMDQQGGKWTIPDTNSVCNFMFTAHSFITFAYNGSLFYATYLKYPDFEKEGNTPAIDIINSGDIRLSNSGDAVVLYDSSDNVIDAVVWGAGAYGQIIPFKKNVADGASIERVILGMEGPETSPDNEDMSSGVWNILPSPTPQSAGLIVTALFENEWWNDQHQAITIHPNPIKTTGNIRFFVSAPATALISIYSVSGEVIFNFSKKYMVSGMKSLYWREKKGQEEGVASGIYILNVVMDLQVYRGYFVKID